MSEANYQGGCLCGAIRFEVRAPVTAPHTCSCTFCQRHTGALTVAWVEVERDSVAWTGPGGAPATYRSSATSSRAFCPACGSSLGAIDDAPTMALLVGTFDNTASDELRPQSHSYQACWPRWWHISDGGTVPPA